MHVSQVDPGQVRPVGDGSGRQVQQVEAEPEGAAVLPVVDLGLAIDQVKPGHLVLGADVDPHGPELLRLSCHQVIEGMHRTTDQVGDAAGRVTGPAALLQSHDVQIGRPAASLGRGRHPRSVTPDHQQPISHP